MNILNRLQTAVLAILMLGTLTGCGGGAASGGETGSGDPVRIATKPMTEQYILGEMLGLLIEQAGYDVEITKGVGGGTSNIQPAMERRVRPLSGVYLQRLGTGAGPPGRGCG